jgi:hypothetical protein
VISLDYNLLSVSQLYQIDYNCLFVDAGVMVFIRSDDSVAFKGVIKGKIYLVDFLNDKVECVLNIQNQYGLVMTISTSSCQDEESS